MAPLLADVPPARLFEEVCKLFLTGHALRSMEALQRFGLAATLFPGLPKGSGPGKVRMGVVLRKTLENTDQRVRNGQPVTPAFLFAALLWDSVCESADHYRAQGESEYMAMVKAAEDVIARQSLRTAIPRRFSAVTRHIWIMQARFAKTKGKRWKRLLYDQRFRAGYDFLLLRAEEDESLKPLGEFWTEAQEGLDLASRPDPEAPARRSRPRRRGGRRSRRAR
jgi:poly(A) polymerase